MNRSSYGSLISLPDADPVPLGLVRVPSRNEAAAWLLSGTVNEWVQCLNAAGVRLNTSQQWYVLPDQGASGRSCVLLVGAIELPVTPHCQPYQRLGDRLYTPADAQLSPALLPRELSEFFHAQYDVWCWHPALGLIAFETQDALSSADLLSLPEISHRNWNRTQPGCLFNTRLHSLRGVPPTLQEINEEGRGDIGSEDPKALGDKPSGMLPGGLAGNAARAAAYPFAWGLDKLAGLMSHVGSWFEGSGSNKQGSEGFFSRTLNSWAEWANQLTAEILSERQREMNRLMEMLEDNPDEGLKYALPFAGDGQAGRGLSPPGSRLTEHSTNFRLGGMGGGGAADVWDIPPETQYQLYAKYRELAQRELALGRFRRAAYIYAELLGDTASAAAALKQGKFFREAAVIYREKLRQPRIAAECLEQGGLIEEAIEIYDELLEHEHVGDLYQQLELPEEARTAWQRAALKCITQNSRLQAARIQEQKLHDVPTARDTLRAAWPFGMQHESCLEAEFQLLARHHMHQEAKERIDELQESKTVTEYVPALVRILVKNAGEFPEQSIASQAADAARVVASRTLMGSNRSSQQKVLGHLRELEKVDLQHARDCDRYGRASERKTPGTYKLQKVRLRRIVPLNQDIEWFNAVGTTRSYYIVGRVRRRLVVLRGGWEDGSNRHDWVHWGAPQCEKAPLIAVDEHVHSDRVWVHLPDINPEFGTPQKLPASDTGPEAEIGTNSTIRIDTHAMLAPEGILWSACEFMYPVTAQDRAGFLTQAFMSPEEAPQFELEQYGVHSAADAYHIYFAWGGWVHQFSHQGGSPECVFEVPGPIHAIAALDVARGSLVAVEHADRVEIWHTRLTKSATITLESSVNHSRLLFLPDQRLLIVTGSTCQLVAVRINKDGVAAKVEGEFQLQSGHPLAILPLRWPVSLAQMPSADAIDKSRPLGNAFAVLTSAAAIEIFDVPLG